MLEYFPGDGNHPVDVPGVDVPAVRPDDWVPASGVAALGTAATAAEPLSFTYTVTPEDLVASVLAHEATRRSYEAQLWKAGWRRSLPMTAFTLGLVFLANIFMFELDLGWSLLSTALLGVLFAVVQWSQIDHNIKGRLPGLLEKQALHELAQRGDQRRIGAETAGLTLGDAAATGRFGWNQVHLAETDRYVIVAAELTRWAIPKSVGEPLASFVRLARSHGAG